MKVLFIGLARSIWLFDLNIFNSRGVSLQGMIDRLVERYRFGKHPKHSFDLEDNALSFKSGTFRNSQGLQVLVHMGIYKDGFVADTLSSTNDSTEFLSDVTTWAEAEFGFVVPPESRRAYVSQLDCECDASLSALNPGLERLSKLLGEIYKSTDGRSRVFEVAGIGFWTEDVSRPLAPTAFKFERRIGAPFSENHYFSQAPLETQAHIDFLDQLEAVLKKGRSKQL